MIEKEREAREAAAASAAAPINPVDSKGGRNSPTKRGVSSTAPSIGPSPLQPASTYASLSSGLATGPPPLQSSTIQPSRAAPVMQSGLPLLPSSAQLIDSSTRQDPTPPGTSAGQAAPPGPLPIPPHAQHPLPPSGPSTPSAAQFLASGGLGGSSAPQSAAQPLQNRTGAPMVEFNHAIAFVNKIKNRFNSDPETYKQFLEILQTYQRDTRDIAEVSDSEDGKKRAEEFPGVRTSDKAIQQCS